MQGLVELILNSLYGENVRRDIDQEYSIKSEYWMQTQYDENVLKYWKLPYREYIVKLKRDDESESDTHLKNSMPAHLVSFFK